MIEGLFECVVCWFRVYTVCMWCDFSLLSITILFYWISFTESVSVCVWGWLSCKIK